MRSLDVIGEAAKKVPADFKQEHPGIKWPAMAGMRDRLTHDYFGVDFEIVRDVVRNHIPDLHQELAAIL